MSTLITSSSRRPMRGMNPLYPSSDGQPMAENGLQYRWIVTIQGNLDDMFRERPHVFVAADNLIYPVEGRPEICQAPDVYVAFGRPKGDRGSYIVFEEGGIFPQVIFEIRSPSNTSRDMARKLLFYDEYGAEEYYDYDPNRNRLRGYHRTKAGLDDIPAMNGYISPLLGIRFDTSGRELVIYRPTGERFLTFQEVADAQVAAQNRAEAERLRATRAEQELDRMKAVLRAAGIDPDKPAT